MTTTTSTPSSSLLLQNGSPSSIVVRVGFSCMVWYYLLKIRKRYGWKAMRWAYVAVSWQGLYTGWPEIERVWNEILVKYREKKAADPLGLNGDFLGDLESLLRNGK